MPRLRVAEVFAALSLTTDLASGVPFEKGLRTCVVATAFAGALGWSRDERLAVFHTALLRSIGCTSHAPENAALFVDDTAFQAALKRLDPGDPAVFTAQLARFGDWAPGRGLAQRFTAVAATEGPRAARAGCEVSRALGGRLGLPAAAIDALDDVYERWDGLGIPDGRSGEQLSTIGRAVHVAEQAVFAHADGGVAGARAEVGRRAGGHLDPDLASAFLRDADLPLDNNFAERNLRAQAVGRKNWLHAGSHEAAECAAVAYTLIQTAKLHGLDVRAYLTWALERVAAGRTDPSVYATLTPMAYQEVK